MTNGFVNKGVRLGAKRRAPGKGNQTPVTGDSQDAESWRLVVTG